MKAIIILAALILAPIARGQYIDTMYHIGYADKGCLSVVQTIVVIDLDSLKEISRIVDTFYYPMFIVGDTLTPGSYYYVNPYYINDIRKKPDTTAKGGE